jgi:hypothetical protein
MTQNLVASVKGTYEYCFSNQKSSAARKRISFHIMGPSERIKLDEKLKDADRKSLETLTRKRKFQVSRLNYRKWRMECMPFEMNSLILWLENPLIMEVIHFLHSWSSGHEY